MSGVLCIISTSLANITRLVSFIRSGFFCIISTSLVNITGLVGFIRSGVLCIISTSLANITGLVEIIQPCGCKKGLHLLYIIDNINENLVYVYKALHCIADHGKGN